MKLSPGEIVRKLNVEDICTSTETSSPDEDEQKYQENEFYGKNIIIEHLYLYYLHLYKNGMKTKNGANGPSFRYRHNEGSVQCQFSIWYSLPLHPTPSYYPSEKYYKITPHYFKWPSAFFSHSFGNGSKTRLIGKNILFSLKFGVFFLYGFRHRIKFLHIIYYHSAKLFSRCLCKYRFLLQFCSKPSNRRSFSSYVIETKTKLKSTMLYFHFNCSFFMT